MKKEINIKIVEQHILEFPKDRQHMMFTTDYKAEVFVLLIRKYGIVKEVKDLLSKDGR